jgi:putative transposase
MLVNRVEQHQIKKTDSIWKIIDDLCWKSKNVYNCANYIIRQEFINNHRWIRYNELDKLMQKQDCYYELGSQCSQQTLKILDKNWKVFFTSIKDWKKNPKKYLGRPKLPRYKHKEYGRFILTLSNIQFRIEKGYLYFSWKPLKLLNTIVKTQVIGKLMQVRFVPKGGSYVLEIVYETNIPETKNENHNIVGIDIGIDNFATISNNIGMQPIIINGRSIKSINQYYNKKKAEWQADLKVKHSNDWSNRLQMLTDKRNNKVDNFLHNASRSIIDWCTLYNIDTIVIGKNDNWKQESKMSKKTNQSFVQIPHALFIEKLKYKAENKGIKLIETEESYTSGTSFLDNELPIKKNYNKGRRIHRGLFKSNTGEFINADLNGAYQIIKKVFPKTFVDGIEGAGSHPIRLNVI